VANGDLSIELIGLDTLTSALARWGVQAPAAMKQVMNEEANIIFRKSQIRAPFRFGVLRGSGRVESGITSIEISYGGAARAYAYIMHEGIINGRPIHYRTPGTGKHYLAIPVAEAMVDMPARLTSRLEMILGHA
jgi:hypothetical protein